MNNTIRVQRAIKNITQEELAQALKMSRQTVNSIETKKTIPSTVTTLKMAKYFGVKAEEIFSLEEGE